MKEADESDQNAAILKAAADLLGDQISKYIDSLHHSGCHGCCHCHCHCHDYRWCFPWPQQMYGASVLQCNTPSATVSYL